MSPQDWRKELGKSFLEMACFVGVTQRSWYNYETGLRSPPLDVMVRCEEMSRGRVTMRSWLGVALAQPKPARLYGDRLAARQAGAARA